MTIREEQYRPVALTEQQLEQVTGGAANNNFNNETNTVTLKFTGSASKGSASPNPGGFNGGHGQLNFHQHVPA